MKVSGKSISIFLSTALLLIISCSGPNEQSPNNSRVIAGIEKPVEIIVDNWGIPHIYAETESDLFFGQGYNAARDRLFQLEIWRRQATGTVSEIFGADHINRDIGTRLFMYRGDLTTELNHYHDRGEQIINSYVNGINAYIRRAQEDPSLLPPEFEILGIAPKEWTAEVVISRHQGLLGNIGQELNFGRAVAAGGEDAVKSVANFKPTNPDISLDPSITSEMLAKDILGLYNAFRRGIDFKSDDETVSYDLSFDQESIEYLGSNNWIINGELSKSGFPMMANDPHRTQAVPSLRYMAHLNGPGWDVIGGGEPSIPGISIGHNGVGAWGLTVFRTDGEDLYVYDINPENPNQYKYKDEWVDMEIIKETISVKGQDDLPVELKYTRHGPVTYVDTEFNKAYAVRCAWLEPGGSPYLASLRMDQAQTWEEFKEACNYSNIPGENMIWADKEGNIGWQAVGIAPLRRNWSGLVPVPGDGRYEWDGYLPIIEKPNVTNPETGHFGTANEYVVPDGYPHMDAIGFTWSDSFRGDYIREVLGSGEKFGMDEMMDLQTSYFSGPAREIVPIMLGLEIDDELTSRAIEVLSSWDFHLDPNSAAAAIYVMAERNIQRTLSDRLIPESIKNYVYYVPMELVVNNLKSPSDGIDVSEVLSEALKQAVSDLAASQGGDISTWKYGDPDFKHIELKHPIDDLLSEEQKERFNVGKMPRGGNSFTLNNTASGNRQTHGASFRLIVDTGDFDATMGTNSPGQSGDVRDNHYKDLYEAWANDQYFPVYYSREMVEANADRKIVLLPKN